MERQYIYLVFTNTQTWLSKLISGTTRMRYVHVSISFDDRFTRMYSFGRKALNNPFSGGFVEESLHGGIYKKNANCEYAIYRINVSNMQFESLQKQVRHFLKSKSKYRYNFLGLFLLCLNISKRRELNYFCAEFVAELLINSKVMHSDKTPHMIKTDELLRLENKEIVATGLTGNF